MKCDELKDYDYDPDFPFKSRGRFYVADEVEAAIDELKAAHHKERHEYIKMIAELKQKLQDQCISCPVKMQEDDVVAELKQNLEDAKATVYAESVDAGMRERRLRRSLCRAIALFCARSCEYFNGIMSHCLIGQEDLYKRCEKKKNKYLHTMYKCRAKMEEYK